MKRPTRSSRPAAASSVRRRARDLAHEFTLWLDCDDEVILARLGDVERPLLAERPAEALAKLRRDRVEWYREVSRSRIDTSASLDEVIARVTREVGRLTR